MSTDFANMLVSIVLLPYLAGVAFFHSHAKRCAPDLGERLYAPLRWLAWILLLLSFAWTSYQFGAVRGIFYQLFAASLVLLLSLLIATRWPWTPDLAALEAEVRGS